MLICIAKGSIELTLWVSVWTWELGGAETDNETDKKDGRQHVLTQLKHCYLKAHYGVFCKPTNLAIRNHRFAVSIVFSYP